MVWTYLLPVLAVFTFIIWKFYRTKIFTEKPDPNLSKTKLKLAHVFSCFLIAGTLSIPIFGFLSLINRKLPFQQDYILKGEILKLDSSKVDNTSYIEYQLIILEQETNKKYDFQIRGYEYSRLKGQKKVEIKMKKGALGILYDF